MNIQELFEAFRDPEVLAMAKQNFVLETVKAQLVQAAGVEVFLNAGVYTQSLIGESLLGSTKNIAEQLFRYITGGQPRFQFVKDENGHGYCIPIERVDEFRDYVRCEVTWKGTDFREYEVSGFSGFSFTDPRVT